LIIQHPLAAVKHGDTDHLAATPLCLAPEPPDYGERLQLNLGVDQSRVAMSQPSALFVRALIAFLAMPAMVAGVIPWMLRPATRGPDLTAFAGAGVVLGLLGSGLLVWCVVVFYYVGRGTLAPWAPPETLVTAGPYRHSRNPMYLAVLGILCGWAIVYQSRTLLWYAVGVGLLFEVRVRFFEEPWLARRDGDAWAAYSGHVPRWIGRRVERPGTDHTAPR
jgi:protein-S-isoprenylcysteine O-methyltransferase Ste14